MRPTQIFLVAIFLLLQTDICRGACSCTILVQFCASCLSETTCCALGASGCCSVDGQVSCYGSSQKCCTNPTSTNQILCDSSEYCCFNPQPICCSTPCDLNDYCPVPTTRALTSGALTTASNLTTYQITSGQITTAEVTTKPLTTQELTTNELTTRELTTNEVTSGVDLTTQSLTTGAITTGKVETVEETDETPPPVQSSSGTDSSSSGMSVVLIGIIAGAAALLLIGLMLILLAVRKYSRRRNSRSAFPNFVQPSPLLQSASSMEMQPVLLTDISAKIPELKNVEVRKKLGEGSFGEVYVGVWNETKVALKKLKGGVLEFDEFRREAGILFNLVHPNCVQFLGVFISDSNDHYIVTEYLSRGNCKDLLAKNANLSVVDLLDMATSAAKGMTYLEDKGIIHRDLACRNLLVVVVEGRYQLKVSDFGLSKEISDDKSDHAKVPIRWTAPELLLRKASASLKTDVWAYGVTLWEIFSLGGFPYSDLTNKEVIQQVPRGVRLPRPTSYCPQEIYDLMLRCWKEQPSERPMFAQLAIELKAIRKAVKREMEMLKTQPSASSSSIMRSLQFYGKSTSVPALPVENPRGQIYESISSAMGDKMEKMETYDTLRGTRSYKVASENSVQKSDNRASTNSLLRIMKTNSRELASKDVESTTELYRSMGVPPTMVRKTVSSDQSLYNTLESPKLDSSEPEDMYQTLSTGDLVGQKLTRTSSSEMYSRISSAPQKDKDE